MHAVQRRDLLTVRCDSVMREHTDARVCTAPAHLSNSLCWWQLCSDGASSRHDSHHGAAAGTNDEEGSREAPAVVVVRRAGAQQQVQPSMGSH